MQESALNDGNFTELFPEIFQDSETAEFFADFIVLYINVYRKTRSLEIIASSQKLIPACLLAGLEEKLTAFYQSGPIVIKVKYNLQIPMNELLNAYWDSIIFIVGRRVALCRGILSDCTWNLNENRLSIRLKTKGAEILKFHGCHALIEDIVEQTFSRSIKVEFDDTELDEGFKGEYLEQKVNEESKIIYDALVVQNGKKPSGNGKKAGNGTLQQNPGIVGVILGKSFDSEIMKIADVTQDSGKIAVSGTVLSVDFKEIRGGRIICVADVTDYTSSLTIKFFLEKNDLDTFKAAIRQDISVKIRGEVQYDKFSKELTVFTSDIVEIPGEITYDSAEFKRVELHAHTRMSSMDGVTPVKELVKRAAQWGHKALAITDHGVVQAFPEASEAAKKHGIKIIYGMECYLVDDGIPTVYNPGDNPLDGEFVVLDVETTGLYAEKDRITEIGAVKIRNGLITDVYSTFVNPGVQIPANIVKLTGITNDMVENAPAINLVLPGLLKFIGDACVVAHNAPFDMGFIRHCADSEGIRIDKPVIDTLQLCRELFPGLEKYKLDFIAGHLGIDTGNRHRAVDDSRTTAQVFLRCLEILKNKGAKTVYDIHEMFCCDDSHTKADSYHAVILVKNYAGLRNLYRIVSCSHLKYFYKKPRIPRSLFFSHRNGLILGSACEAGELFRSILDDKSDEEIARIARFYDYLEIQPLGNNQFLINSGRVGSQEQLKDINRRIVKLGEKYKKPVVATCDVHFLDPRDEVFRRILMSGQGYEDADNQAPLFFRTTDCMLEEFAYLGAEKAFEVVVTNTNMIADSMEDIVPIPKGTFPPRIDGAEEEIRRLAEGKAKEIYGDSLPGIVEKRLEAELGSIIKNGFSVMYIIAQKLVAKSLEDGYLVGSRGSVGSSFVANLIGITEVNSLQPHYICRKCRHSEFIVAGSAECGFDLPDKVCPICGTGLEKDGYDILFETFLGFEGDKEPDIDLNFSGEYQPKAHKYTEELFGESHVFRAGTIATIADKTAYGFVKNYLDEKGIVVTNAEINRLVKGCAGVKRTTGQHPGGIMIVPQDREIYEFSPIQRPADDTGSDTITTHFDYDFLHGRILKLDILGHDDPTVIKMLEDLTGVDAKTIPMAEEKTMGIFRSTEPLGIKPGDIGSEVGTFGIPEFGTKFVRQILVDTKPTTFSELVRICGLSHGTDVWLNNAQELIKSRIARLSEVICTRDDIMLYLIHAGLEPKTAFGIMEDVRRGRGLKEEFETVMREKKVPEWYIESCKKIKYMFPKAHAAAYVMMAFRIAWFKIYYPEAFYVSYFTVRADEFDAELMTHGQDRVRNKIKELEKKGNDISQKENNVLTILYVVNEMYARGIRFLPVDLYKSDAVKFILTKDGIRPSLNALQGLGGAAAQNIVEARKEGIFLSVEDMRIRTKINKTVIEILQQYGCMDNMPENNQLSLC